MDTSIFSHLNWLHILVAALAYFILGAVWYNKAVFGSIWIKTTGVEANNPEAKKGMGGVMVFTFLLEFIVCIALAILINKLNLSGWIAGIKLGLFTGVLFSGIGICISYLYQMKPKVLSVIDGGYHTVGQIIAAVILCIWH